MPEDVSADYKKTERRKLPPPSTPITDPRFVYVPAALTDVRKTFERARAQYNLK